VNVKPVKTAEIRRTMNYARVEYSKKPPTIAFSGDSGGTLRRLSDSKATCEKCGIQGGILCGVLVCRGIHSHSR
jgi:hypothetical protein